MLTHFKKGAFHMILSVRVQRNKIKIYLSEAGVYSQRANEPMRILPKCKDKLMKVGVWDRVLYVL